MSQRVSLLWWGGCLIVAAFLLSPPAATAIPQQEIKDDEQAIAFYETKIKPILEAHCFKCHGNEGRTLAGLKLTDRQSILHGGDSGPAVDLEDPDASLLLEAVNYQGYEMPPSGKLDQDQIDLLTKWVKLGVPVKSSNQPAGNAPPAHAVPQVSAETKQFWSFQPVKPIEIPAVQDRDWATNPIDHFVLAQLESSGLTPSRPASRTALLRRAYYDLIGLPPTPQEVRAFLADSSPDAFEKVVDRLLASPHYGEKWGRHWLDLVRYAETNSFERDGAKPFVWRYRDYVIRSLNEDKPYDQFILEQLAGDELLPTSPESIIATGYYRLGAWDDEPSDPQQALFDDLDDILATTSQTFLGLTINCARCHDHKLDPIPQEDYYRLLAFFRNVRRYGVRSHPSVLEASVREIASEDEKRRQQQQIQLHQREVKKTEQQLKAIEDLVLADFQDVEHEEFKHPQSRIDLLRKRVPRLLDQKQFDQYVQLTLQLEQLNQHQTPALAQALCVKEHGVESPDTFLLIRGNAHAHGKRVEPGFPQILSPPQPEISVSSDSVSSGRRLALARWIASTENPLTARVMVNRLWQFHFGRGIVRSSNDFGMQGTAPTHPQLLDWLAGELVRGGWRLKSMHRLIMLSSTYRMAYRVDAEASAKDPENNLFWRFPMRRLTAEEIRDSILQVSGNLTRDKMFGPSVYPIIPKEVLAGQSRPGSGWGRSTVEDQNRRSIYIHVKRSLITPILANFDFADTDFSCPVRFTTTQAPQALGMMNSEFVQHQAQVFAETLRRLHPDDLPSQVGEALWRTWQRSPTDQEIQQGVDFVNQQRSDSHLDEAEALRLFCIVALNMNEFFFLD